MSITRWIKPWSQKICDDSTNKSSTRKKRILNERMDATEGSLLYIYIYILLMVLMLVQFGAYLYGSFTLRNISVL